MTLQVLEANAGPDKVGERALVFVLGLVKVIWFEMLALLLKDAFCGGVGGLVVRSRRHGLPVVFSRLPWLLT